MPITVVVGGQFGGEGKGKTVAHLCRNCGYDAAVRCGGPNSGHTITLNNKQVVLRQIPAGIVNSNTKLFLGAGCILDLDVLSREISHFGLHPDRLKIDHNALILKNDYAQKEKENHFDTRIGSTCTGTGIAVAERVMRRGNVSLATDIPLLEPYLTDVSKDVQLLHLNGKRIIVEGTQGFGLSLYHSPYYPYVTSRDTTASSFLSEIGVSPLIVSEIVMVLRTFPIRVGGNSGPLPNEITWKAIQLESGYQEEILELTTVTNRVRRVGRFDIEIAKKAAIANMPTQIVLMGADYLDCRNRNAKHFEQLTEKTREFISWLERELNIEIGLIGTGPTDFELIDKWESIENEQKRYGEEKVRSAALS